MADAQASGACGRKTVRVQVPLPALFFYSFVNVLHSEKLTGARGNRHSVFPGSCFIWPLLFYLFLNMIHLLAT